MRRAITFLCVAFAAQALAAAPASGQARLEGFHDPGQLAVSSDGAHVYTVDAGGVLAFRRDSESGEITLIGHHFRGGRHVELTPDGRHLYVVGGAQGQDTYPTVIRRFARDPASGTLTDIGPWTPRQGWLRDIEFLDDRVAYAVDDREFGLLVLDRDPATGDMSLRREMRQGEGGVDGLTSADSLAIAPGWLYVGRRGNPISSFRLSETGEPTLVPDPDCACLSGNDIELFPDASRLIAGSLFDRDASTGRLTERQRVGVGSGGPNGVADGLVGVSPDGGDVYLVDGYENRIVHLRHGPDGLAFRRDYYDGRDGQGIRFPRALALAPDGRHLYLTAGSGAPQRYTANVSVFRRDPATGDLTFVQMFGGSDYRNPEDPPAPTLTIDGGAEYTNDRDVVLTVQHRDWPAMWLDVANDGGFGDAQRFQTRPAGLYPWRLATTGPERLPKTVYARLTQGTYTWPYTLTDDIILDERPPEVVRARIDGSRLRLKARDNRSGVRRLQVTASKSKPGKTRKYASKAKLSGNPRKLYVRVFDGAGNRSKWRIVRR